MMEYTRELPDSRTELTPNQELPSFDTFTSADLEVFNNRPPSSDGEQLPSIEIVDDAIEVAGGTYRSNGSGERANERDALLDRLYG